MIAAAAIAGCGGSSSGTSSQDEFAQNADNICTDVGDRVFEIRRTTPQSEAELRRLIDRQNAAVEDGIKRLQALETPTGKEGTTARRFTRALAREFRTQVQPAVRRLERAVAARDRQAFEAAAKKLGSLNNTESKRLASQLGATECAATN